MGGSNLLSYLGSMGLIAILNQFIPRPIWQLLGNKTNKLLNWFSWFTEISVDEFDSNMSSNEVYELVDLHVSSLTSNTRRLRLSQLRNAAKLNYSPDSNQSIPDTFQGATFRWEHRIQEPDQGSGRGSFYARARRTYVVTAHQRYMYNGFLRRSYMNHVITHGKTLRHQSRDRMLFTNIRSESRRSWRSVPFKHASTFQSIALPEKTKEMVMRDLDAFCRGEEFFRRVGRAWKRGYLLHGPPGTGKSSLIAAIANYAQYDVYDLELTEVKSNANLRELLMEVSSKSIIVIEDIDCSLELKKRGDPAPDDPSPTSDAKKDDKKEEDAKSRVTLSGLLNFIDGLWSCIGDERIIVFTTNYKDQLDPALIRPGRMDLHIPLSYCGFEAFRTLAWTHLEIKGHRLFGEIEGLLQAAQRTPADVAEVLIQNRYDADAALENLVKALSEAADGKRDSDAGKGVVEEELDPALNEPIHG